MNLTRMSVCLFLGLVFGIFCAYGTINANVPGLVITNLLLLTIIYNRILIGFFIGVVGDIVLVRNELLNAALRGGLMGLIISLAMAIPGGLSALVPVLFGIGYGVIIDVAATKLAPSQVVCYSVKEPTKKKKRK